MSTLYVSKLRSANAQSENVLKNWDTLIEEHFNHVRGLTKPVTIDVDGSLYHGEAIASPKPTKGDDEYRIDITGLKATTKGPFQGIVLRYGTSGISGTPHTKDVQEQIGFFGKDDIFFSSDSRIKINSRLFEIRSGKQYQAQREGEPPLPYELQGWNNPFSIPSYPGFIALITDFGYGDSYVGDVKGAILNKNSKATLYDITHNVPPFNIRRGSYLLDKSAKAAPLHTVFIGVVDPGVGTSREAIAVETLDGKRYVVPNNGLLTHVLNSNEVRAAHRIENRFFLGELYTEKDKTFHGRDVFGPAAAVLAYGFPLGWIGPVADNLIKLSIASPNRDDQGRVTGEIEHVDHYGNVVTNIDRDLLYRFKPGDKLVINAGDRTFEVDYVETYAQTPKGTWVGVITSDHTFEIARNQESANETLKLKAGNTISILQKKVE